MRRVFGIALFLLGTGGLIAQNLVPNPGFEQVIKPVRTRFPGNIEQAMPWFPAGLGSPDLFRGSESARRKAAAEGQNYAGLILYDGDNPGFREYLEVKLLEPLLGGMEYCLRMKVSLSAGSYYATDQLGIALEKDTVLVNNWDLLSLKPVVSSASEVFLNDTSGWRELNLRFKADGGEQFLILGNFKPDALTRLRVSNGKAFFRQVYLLLDQVELKACDPPVIPGSPPPSEVPAADVPRKPTLFVPNLITPNDDGFNDELFIPGLPVYSKIRIYNREGKQVFSSDNYKNDWKGEGLPEGLYNYELQLPDGNVIYGGVNLVRRKK